MKVCIITVFKAQNCGSFLQAWALKEQLSSIGNEVSFSDYKTPRSIINKTITVIKCCLKLNFRRANDVIKKAKAFSRCQKNLKIQKGNAKADIYFFGSDTLWNFNDKFFSENVSFFTGGNINKPCYAYAISVASTAKEVFMQELEGIKNIQKFKQIAVRDSHTESVLLGIYPKEQLVKVVDPTMLMDNQQYIKSFSTKRPVCEKSLVIYYFGVLPENIWRAIKEFAQKKGLKTVAVGIYEKQFDYAIVPTPENFITEFANAEYIFTNTFHGCVFSTIFNKQFATDGIRKKKIEGFLEEFSLFDRVVACPEDIEKVLTAPINYQHVNTLVENCRSRSIDYLTRAIDEVKVNE